MDYCCIVHGRSLNNYFVQRFKEIAEASDVVFTPVTDICNIDVAKSPEPPPPSAMGDLSDYGVDNWYKGDYAYLNRAWCRIEMFYLSVLPIYFVIGKRDLLHGNLKFAYMDKRRPHIVYSTQDQRNGLDPLFLKYDFLQTDIRDKYCPLTGKVSFTADMQYIKKLYHIIVNYIDTEKKKDPIRRKYQGERNKLGQKHGQGLYVDDGGNVYEGQWERSKQHGYGKLSYVNGDVYEGDWEAGMRHGQGTYTYKDRSVYRGGYHRDMKQGMARYQDMSGNEYVGNFHENNIQGDGKMKLLNGDVYDGKWVNNLHHGTGTMTYCETKDWYMGQWEQGAMQGKGKYVYGGDKSFYIGEFKDNKRHGFGVMTYANGSVYSGMWKDDVRNGSGEFLTASSDIICGTWTNGSLVASDGN